MITALGPSDKLDTSLNELGEWVRNVSGRILALLLIMRKDDAMEWNSDYGFRLIKLEEDIMGCFRKTFNLPSDHQEHAFALGELYVDFRRVLSKHKHTAHEVGCYVRTMG